MQEKVRFQKLMKFSLIKTTKDESAIKFENLTEMEDILENFNVSALAQAKIYLKWKKMIHI